MVGRQANILVFAASAIIGRADTGVLSRGRTGLERG